jgi:hypothetical protein
MNRIAFLPSRSWLGIGAVAALTGCAALSPAPQASSGTSAAS